MNWKLINNLMTNKPLKISTQCELYKIVRNLIQILDGIEKFVFYLIDNIIELIYQF